jgi:hypothetical protein
MYRRCRLCTIVPKQRVSHTGKFLHLLLFFVSAVMPGSATILCWGVALLPTHPGL